MLSLCYFILPCKAACRLDSRVELARRITVPCRHLAVTFDIPNTRQLGSHTRIIALEVTWQCTQTWPSQTKTCEWSSGSIGDL